VDVVGAAAKLIELANRVGEGMSDAISSREIEEKLSRLPTRLGPYGVDEFGFDPAYVKRIAGFAAWVYRRYFRAEVHGVENIPDGRCLIVSNHSGQLPFDGAMLTVSLILDRDPPRYVRSMVERFVPSTPFVSTFLARCGQILGTPENCRRLLAREEAILVFPEGVRGLNKTWGQRYRLQRFGQGFMRLALETKAPIVPTVVIGAEEQAPSFFNLRAIGKAVGLPAFPVTLTHPWLPLVGMLPLPVKYRIYFGKPMSFEGNANDEDDVVARKVDQVRGQMQRMIDEGLAARPSAFW
jgi:1-acyl-sn-glycerol-3-phosphate acyltransferase